MANWFVDNTNTPPGTGTSGDPYSSIQNAFNNGALAAGDHIKIRTGSGTYSESATITKSGAVGNPIIIEPDTANTPNIVGNSGNPGAALNIRASNITVQNLTFDGTGIWSRYALRVEPNTTANIQNIIITGCTITAMGGTESQANDSTAAEGGILVRNTSGTQWTVDTFTISNNTFNNNRGQAMFLSGVANGTISGNTIANMLRGRTNDGMVEIGIKMGSDNSAPTPSTAHDSGPHTISSNIIHDFQDVSAWTLTPGAVGANIMAIYGDVRAANVTVQDNVIYKIAENTTSNAACLSNTKCSFVNVIGIHPESGCSNWTIQRNLIYRVGKTGVRVGSSTTHFANNTNITNNTVYKVAQYCFDITLGLTETIKNNIGYQTASSAAFPISFETSNELTANGPHTIDYNCWYNPNNTNIARINGSTYNFANWKTQLASQIGQDAHSVNADPLFVSLTTDAEDFHLVPGSPAINSGEGGVSMGAYPAQIVVVPIISAVTVTQIFFSGFTVTWTTDIVSDTQVDYGTTISYGSSTALDSTLTKSHSATIVGLTANTIYHFRVKSKASGGTTQNSGDFSVITVLPAPTSVVAS